MLPAIDSNERLEFLGDAVLGMLVSHVLYRAFPHYDEGQLTEARSALVRRSTLAMLADERGLGPLLYTGRAERQRSGKGYATVLAEAYEAVLAAVSLIAASSRRSGFLTVRSKGAWRNCCSGQRSSTRSHACRS